MNKVLNIEKFKVSCKQCSLKEQCFPHGMAEQDISKLDEAVETHSINKGDYLFREADACRALYAVRSGCVKTTVQNAAGESQIVSFHLPGELFGFDGFATDLHACTAQALETTSVCELPLDDLEHLCQTMPGLQKQMRRIMGIEVNNDHELLLLLGKMNADEKLATFLLNVSTRMKQRHWKEDEFNLSMSRQDIANYLGLAVETVCRLFAQFQDNGFINVDKRHIEITNMDALKTIVGDCTGNAKQGKV